VKRRDFCHVQTALMRRIIVHGGERIDELEGAAEFYVECGGTSSSDVNSGGHQSPYSNSRQVTMTDTTLSLASSSVAGGGAVYSQVASSISIIARIITTKDTKSVAPKFPSAVKVVVAKMAAAKFATMKASTMKATARKPSAVSLGSSNADRKGESDSNDG
jgi:hypothetical protein